MSLYDDDEVDVSSTSNPRVRSLVELRKRRVRDQQQVAVLEGHAELALALEAGVVPREVYYSPSLVRDALPLNALERARAHGTKVISLSESAFRKASYRDSPDGWLAVVESPARPLEELELFQPALVLVCEAIEKPGNLGAMLRTAEAVGADAVVAASPVADWGNPNVIRASKGTVFAVPVASAPAVDVISWLRSNGVAMVVATPDADALLSDADLTGSTAIVVGSEHEGVSGEFREAAAAVARLPMFGQVNSLNVATAAAVALYEVRRQRGSRGGAHLPHSDR
jgi:TrmH family RNA methyltransferase